jgi:DNA-binding NarL/FixJ family response regulator
MSVAPVRVTLVEDHTLLAESLLVALDGEGFLAMSVSPRAGRAVDLLPAIEDTRPDVVLLDLDLGRAGRSTPLVGPLRAAGRAVVVVTGVRQRALWGECLAAGADTVLPKSAPLDAIVATVRAAARGARVMPTAQRDELVGHWREACGQARAVDSRFARLSSREQEVLAALVDGRRVRDIAADSCVAESTVRSQVKSLLAKLGVTSQLAAVALARETGWRVPAPSAARIR